jgi:hypothetical protein
MHVHVHVSAAASHIFLGLLAHFLTRAMHIFPAAYKSQQQERKVQQQI